MHLQADAMTQPVVEFLAEAGLGNIRPRGRVNFFGRRAGAHPRDGACLSL